MKSVIILLLISFCSNALALRSSIKVDIELSPAGSFSIESNRIRGQVSLIKGELTAKDITIPVNSLKTGIELRDEHMKKKLGIEKDPNAKLKLVEAKGSNGKGTAVFEVLGKKQTSTFTYKLVDSNKLSTTFSLSLEKFGITGVSYMGVGVQDKADVEVILPYEVK